ncbi:hypothetical protein MRX96_021292 [Rhipicephalus microplus]
MGAFPKLSSSLQARLSRKNGARVIIGVVFVVSSRSMSTTLLVAQIPGVMNLGKRSSQARAALFAQEAQNEDWMRKACKTQPPARRKRSSTSSRKKGAKHSGHVRIPWLPL